MGSDPDEPLWCRDLADEVLPGTTYRYDADAPEGKRLFSARFRITRQCNRKCRFCFIPYQSPAAQDSDVSASIEAAVRAGARKVVLSGGEPTLHDDLADLIRRARTAGAEWVELQTNAIRLADRHACQRLRDAGLSSVSVSLPSHCDATLAAITGVQGGLSDVLRALEHLAALDVTTSITHVICPQNARDVAPFVRFLAEGFAFQKLSFLFAAPFVPELARPDLIVRFSDAISPLREALDYCLEREISFEGLSERCGLPECLLAGDARYYGQAEPIVAANRDPLFIDAPACGPCQRRDSCYRVRALYAYLYGVAELRPVLRSGVVGEAPVASMRTKALARWLPASAATVLEPKAVSCELLRDVVPASAPNPSAAADMLQKVAWLGAKLELDEAQRKRLVELDGDLEVSLRARSVDGQSMIVSGWRARYAATRGPTVGALEITSALDGSTCRAAAIFRGLRAAAFGLPMGGAHGGLACDPSHLGGEGLADAIAQLLRQLGAAAGGGEDCLTPHHSVGTDILQRSMDSLMGDERAGVRLMRGWPMNQLGGPGHMPAVSSAVAAALFALARYRKPQARAMRYALWGFGRAGQRISLLLESRNRGSVLVGCADSLGGCMTSAGLDAVALRAAKSRDGRLPDVARTDSAAVLGADVDVLFLAAPGGLDGSAARSVMAPVVVDISAAVAADAEQVILDRGSVFVPSAVATCGPMIGAAEELQAGRRVVAAGAVERRIAKLVGNVLPRMLAAGEHFGLTMTDALMALGLLALADRQ